MTPCPTLYYFCVKVAIINMTSCDCAEFDVNLNTCNNYCNSFYPTSNLTGGIFYISIYMRMTFICKSESYITQVA